MKYSIIPLLLVMILFAACAEKRSHEVTSGKIPVGNLRVYYEQQGEGEAIIFLHAGLQDHTMWAEQVKALSPDYKVITIDMPFHGKTTGKDTAILAKNVVKAVLDSLQIRKVSIIGLSMGAAVVQDFIIAYPERVNRAVLISAGLNGYDQKFGIDSITGSWYTRFMAALEAKDTAGAALEFTKSWGEGMDQHGDSLTKPASRYVYETTLATLRQHKLEGWPNLQDIPTAFEEISKVRLPVLIIHGDKDLPFIAVTSEYMEKNIPGAKRVLLKGAAHMLNMEQPGEVNRLLKDFLQSQ